MTRINPPNALDLNAADMNVEFGDFMTSFRYYSAAIGLDDVAEERKVGTLMSVIGRPAQKIADRNFTYTVDRAKTMANLLTDFSEYFSPQRNQLVMRHRLLSRKQQSLESVGEYMTTLRDLAAYCDLEKVTPDIYLRDLFICGVADNELKQHLLQLDSTKATLTEALRYANAFETAKSGEKELSCTVSSSVNAVRGKPNAQNNRPYNKYTDGNKPKHITNCKFCGRDHEIRKCPAYGKDCSKCGRKKPFCGSVSCDKRTQCTGGSV